MTNNIGSTDRIIRLLIASTLFYLGLYSFNNSPLGNGLVVAGIIAFVTAVVGFCGLYRILGISTSAGSEQP